MRDDLLFELKGEKAKEVIPRIKQLAADYPYQQRYDAWPGPNSNTFVSYLIRNTPHMGLGLTFGLDVLRPAIKLPFIGRVGFADKSVLF